MIGETFGGYRVIDKIGEGGMGAVYLAEHTLIGRKAAIKVLLPEHSRKQDLVDRFFNEAKTAAGLNHPALVDVFDFGVHASGSAYLVMDYLEGETLGSRLTRVAPLAPEVAVDLARQIARGMEAAHGRGIVHRDLKPDNIFLVPDADDPGHDQVKILDFGIAKLLGTPGGSKGATSTGMVLGTPLFMAPEQCRGTGVVDHRADVYSLGCILYLMLCGRPPFPHEGVGEILAAHLHEPVTPPREINPAVPPALDALVRKALAKKPDERHQSMAALAAELGKISFAEAPPVAPPAPMVAFTTPAPTTFSEAAAAAVPAAAVPVAPGRRRLVAPLAVAFAAGLAVGAAALLRVRTRSPGAAPVAAAPVVPRPAVDSGASATAPAAPVVAQEPEPAPVEKKAAADDARPPRPAAGRRREARTSRPGDEAYARGVVELARGDEQHALEAFRAYLRSSTSASAHREDAERHVLALQGRFGEVEVVCEVDGADVSVDGRPVGRTPLATGVVLVPGTHQLALTKPGYREVRRTFTLVAGDRKPFVFHLDR